MSKQLNVTDMAKIIQQLMLSDILDDMDTYSKFLQGVGDLITEFCGGELTDITVTPSGKTTLSFMPNSSLPENGGVFKYFDTTKVWQDGIELESDKD